MLLKHLLSRLRRTPPPDAATENTADLTFFGGKGGVGKTTCATAWALQHAGPQNRTLLISTDPAHSLGDLLGRRLSTEPRAITADLDALELTPDAALADYIAEVKANLRGLSSPELRAAAERQADLAAAAPGAHEAALFEAMVRCILDLGTRYDELIFDTAPTGHTLQLLSLPETMAIWTQAMLARRREAHIAWRERDTTALSPEDRAAAILHRRRQRFEAVRVLLTDPDRTRFIPVLNPDALSVDETRRMVRQLTERGVSVPLLLVNRVIPKAAEGDFAAALRATQSRHLEAIDLSFSDLRRWRIDYSSREIQGLDDLRSIALPGG
ncbi:MAG: ArsA family ATPase [Gammaproteobacteria bacterium]|nr:ArsA family ATPase [Gammaproteobacteria bacterium]